MARNAIRRTGRKRNTPVKPVRRTWRKKKTWKRRQTRVKYRKASKLKGYSKRISMAPEMKWFQYDRIPGQLVTMVPTKYWALNGSEPVGVGSQRYFPEMDHGLTKNTMIGDEIVLLWADLEFVLQQATNGYNISPSTAWADFTRIVICSPKGNQQNNFQLASDRGTIGIYGPIDTKKFDIYYDKTFPTRIQTNFELGLAYSAETSPARHFKFKIPLKQKVTDTNEADGVQFEKDVQLYAWTRYSGANWAITDIHVRYHFRDP